MYKINYFFEDIKPFKYGLPTKKWIEKFVLSEGWKIGVLNFIFCSDKYLQKINIKYLKKNYLTDVITFENSPFNIKSKLKDNSLHGDIFISVDRVKYNKKVYKTIFAKELKRVMVHGGLHLMGYDDKTQEERVRMAEKENIYLETE
ncbi:MAG: rRNA maturation RNase YbeY [Flavobacteriales bacterium]|jgi:probable rRNA maturation factor|nr:rRNA maturation RNase YbeY [Flavobacteriales bacterium]|tara:strand:- start:84 stop:521 length:438 start_codon:yes stop_codon:yes gene_type:complete